MLYQKTSKGKKMKKKSAFLKGFKAIVFNQRGSVGVEAAPEAVEAQEEVAPEAVEEQELSEDVSAEAVSESDSESVEVQAETEQELESEIKDAIEEGATEEEIKGMIRQFTLKVDGKEFIKEIDLNDEDAIRRELQLSHKGQKSMQELQELKNTYSSELKRLMEDPFAVLKELDENFDPLDLSASYIDKLLKEQEMSPEEKEAIQRQQEFEDIKAERDKLKQDAFDKEQERDRIALAEEIQTDIMAALSDDSELVADRDTVALVAENLMWAAKNNMHHITAKDVLPTVKEQLRKNFQKSASRFKSTSALKQYMGEDLINKLREERVEQAKKVVKNASSIEGGKSKPENTKEKKEKINLSTLFR
tara:strand:- start:1949 stop:3037 length:1089 start_codon:yes stop_codon:yes gene_type:complete